MVGEHMSGKVCLSPLHLTQPNIPLEEIAMVLKKRQVCIVQMEKFISEIRFSGVYEAETK